MCYAIYTNAQRQGSVLNMTLSEVSRAAAYTRGFTTFHTISVWEHKTTSSFGSAKIVLPEWVFTLLKEYIRKFREGCSEEDLVFVTTTDEKISKIAGELEKLSSQFGKKVQVQCKECLISHMHPSHSLLLTA